MFDVTEGHHDPPTIKQLAVFLPNQVGSLLMLTRCLDGIGIKLRGIAIVDAVDHAVVRLIVDRPALAADMLRGEGYAVCESDLVCVELPDADSGGIRAVLSALLLAELNVHYVYTFVTGSPGTPLLAVHVEDNAAAAATLTHKGLRIIGQDLLE